ncbi:type II toxin-antitoxin system antitoxin SocA domain-containing protein [Xanthomonas campestris pv. raphani]|uniref:Panacea domain-containing protein n=1 Tax=Xanthomonas campestris TaxID=339 RepID=UPI002B236BA2|nr:type II toxin-antitoxin system antitoxin SocA domain-containing protein [Xanthomonas campestris]MEA9911597.1 type II toxin-antitoxin system antitoxin SocA domain-containing protein [Xanthomonas campestris pv. raphani]
MRARTYPSTNIANNLLERAARERRGLTPMQLLKLVYIAHAFSLGYGRGPLINEPVEAWKYGPVVRSLYNQVRDYDGSPVNGLLQTGPNPWDRASQVDAQADQLLQSVWSSYGSYDGYQLSNMTHMPGSPWWITWNDRGGRNQFSAVIDDNLIRDFYESKLRFATQAQDSTASTSRTTRRPVLG